MVKREAIDNIKCTEQIFTANIEKYINDSNVCQNILKMVIAKDHNLNLGSSEARLRFLEYYIKMRIFSYIKFKN